MKRLFVVFGMMFLASQIHAMSNKDAFQRWRATETSTTDNLVFLASGCPCVIHDVLVTSGTGVATSQFKYYGSTTGNLDQRDLMITTSTVFDIDNTGDLFPIDEVVVSTNVYYTKTGASSIRVRWDWFMSPPPGQINKGYKPQ